MHRLSQDIGPHCPIPDRQRTARHPVDRPVIAEHRRLGDLPMRIVNISAQGFRGTGAFADDGAERLSLGERVTVRLPVVGRIEACLIWSSGGRGGFQFERLIRGEDFIELLRDFRRGSPPRLSPDRRSRV